MWSGRKSSGTAASPICSNSGSEPEFSVFLHHALGARGIDDRFGGTVHRLDLFVTPIHRLGASARREELGGDAAADLGAERVQAVVRLGDGAPKRGDAV